MEQRNLDGVYFRINRNNKWENVCFSDLTDTEMDYMLANKDHQWLRELCKILGHKLRKIGDQFDIMSE